MWLRIGLVGGVLLGSLACVAVAQEAAPKPASQDRVEMVKQSFATSQAALRQYGWVETVALSLSGEEKVRQQYQCYYGAEGKLQKVPVAADAKEDKKRGLRGKAVESKKAELEASLKEATALLGQYAPLDPVRIQAAKAAGNVSVSTPDAAGRIRVTLKDYLKPGDQVVVAVDAAKNTLQAVSIASYVEKDKAKNPVTATVSYAALGDGTIYPATETMEISAQKLKVDVQNSGYHKQAQ
jgi:hypothetical protein